MPNLPGNSTVFERGSCLVDIILAIVDYSVRWIVSDSGESSGESAFPCGLFFLSPRRSGFHAFTGMESPDIDVASSSARTWLELPPNEVRKRSSGTHPPRKQRPFSGRKRGVR